MRHWFKIVQKKLATMGLKAAMVNMQRVFGCAVPCQWYTSRHPTHVCTPGFCWFSAQLSVAQACSHTWDQVVGDEAVPALCLGVVCQGSIAHCWGCKSHTCQSGIGFIPEGMQQIQGA